MATHGTSRQRPRSKTKDPKGGLTAAGRRKFSKKDGAQLRPGVRKRTSEMTGEPVPKTVARARAIARRGRALLERAESKKAGRTRARKSAAKKRPGLVDNINARKRAGISRPKARSTVSPESYAAMQRGWVKKPKNKRATAER